MIRLQLGKPREAVSILRRAIREDPRSTELHQGLAVSFIVIGDQRRAEEQFRAALSLQPGHPQASRGLAELLIGQARHDEAIDLLGSYLAAHPTDVETRELLAHAYVISNQYGKARTQLFTITDNEAARSRLSSVQLARTYNNVGFCYVRENRLADASEYFSKALDTESKSTTEIYENLVRVHLITAKPQKALAVLDLAHTNAIETAELALLRSVSLIALRQYSSARQVLEELVASDGAPEAAYADLGWLLGDWEDNHQAAISILNVALDKFGSSPPIVNNLAYSHLALGEVAAARALLDLLPPDDEKLPHMLATKGLLLLWEGNVQEGDRFYKLAADRAGQIGNRRLMLAIRQKRSLEVARALIRQNQAVNALSLIQEGLELPPHGLPFRFEEDLTQLLRGVKELPLPADKDGRDNH